MRRRSLVLLVVACSLVVLAIFAALLWFIGALAVAPTPPGQMPY
jgi:hypothetical protein